MLDQQLLPALAFVALWLGGAAIMSRIAGWHALSALFPVPPDTVGEQFRFCSAKLGPSAFPISYRRCVRVVVADEGLGLNLMFPFRFHSPAFLVPWHKVSSCTEKQSLAISRVTLSFFGTERLVTLTGPLGQLVKARYNAAIASANAA